MQKFADFVLKFRVVIILGTILLTLGLGYSAKDLRINSDILSYLPQDDPLVMLFNEVGDKFGGNSLAMIALENEDIFNYETLTRVNRITREIKGLDEVSQVMSLTDIMDIKKIAGGLEVGKLIDKDNIPQDPKKLKSIKAYILSKDMYRGSLVSADGKITLIIARLKEEADKVALAQQMKKIVQNTPGREKTYYAGIPFQMTFLDEIIKADLGKLVPLVILLIILTLYFSFKSLRGVFLPLITVLISTVWTLGLMSLMKIPLSIASNAIPVLLVAIGSAYGIHMLSKYNEEIHRGEDKIQGIKDALSEVGVPIFLAGITTLIGFLVFLSSSLGLIREFGVFTALGVMFAMLVSVTFLPAVLSFLKVREVKLNHGGLEDNWSTKSMERLGKFVLRREKLLVGICLGTVVIGFLAIPHLNREVNMVDYFKTDSEIRQAEEMMQSKLSGSIPMQILVKGDLKDPFVLKEIIKFEKYLEAQPNVNDPQSIADLICEMNRVMNGHATIPDTREGVANLWFFIEGQDILNQLINSEATEGLVQAKIGTVNTKKLNTLVKVVGRYIQEELKTDMVKFRISLVPGKLANELKKEKAERILSKLQQDIGKSGSQSTIPDKELKTVIMASLTAGQEGFNPDSIKIIAAKINNYLHSEEADIQISAEKVMAGIVRDIGKKLRQTIPDEKDIINLLIKNIPETLYAEDPEVLEYTAASIAAIINEEDNWIRVNQLIEKLRPLFPQELADNKGFMNDLRDDVWEINEDWTVLTSLKYKKIFKNNDYPDENKSNLTAKQTGMPIIYMDIDKKIMQSQALSLSIAIFLVFILLTFRLKSLVGGLISLSPIVLTILVAFTIMVVFNIPLDIVTVLIGSVAVGIGIDYTIHFLSRFKEEFSRCNSEIEALNTTLATTGKAIVINAVSVMLGFLVLVLGNIVPMQRFGYLIALTMILSALASITILPALILVTRAGFIGDFDRLSRKIVSGLKVKVRQKIAEQKEKLGKIRIKKEEI